MENNAQAVKTLTLQLKDKNMLYSCYMPFLEHGGLFVSTDAAFALGEEVTLGLAIGNQPQRMLPTRVAWINTSRASPKGLGLAFTSHELCLQTKAWIENELGAAIKSQKPTFTL